MHKGKDRLVLTEIMQQESVNTDSDFNIEFKTNSAVMERTKNKITSITPRNNSACEELIIAKPCERSKKLVSQLSISRGRKIPKKKK